MIIALSGFAGILAGFALAWVAQEEIRQANRNLRAALSLFMGIACAIALQVHSVYAAVLAAAAVSFLWHRFSLLLLFNAAPLLFLFDGSVALAGTLFVCGLFVAGIHAYPFVRQEKIVRKRKYLTLLLKRYSAYLAFCLPLFLS